MTENSHVEKLKLTEDGDNQVKELVIMDVEDSFSKVVGGFGRYQIFVCFLLSLLSTSLAGLIALPVFTTANITELQKFNYRVENDSSTIYEWNLFNKFWLSDLIQALYFAGFLVGVVLLGQLSDKYSRLRISKLGLVLLFPISLCSSFSSSWEMFAVFRFFTGLFAGGVNTVLYILLQEQIGNDWWPISSAVHGVFYSVGFIIYSILAYFIPPWRRQIQVLAVMQIPTLLSVFFFKHSPRWLYSKNRVDEAEKVLTYLARKNGAQNPVINLKPVIMVQENERNPTLLDIVKNQITLKRLIVLSYVWLVVSFLYYVLILAAGDLDENVYVSEALSGLIDFPSHMLYPWILNRKWAGRKRTLIGSFFIAGSSCLSLTAFKYDDTSKAKIVLGLLGKFFVSTSFSSLYVYTPELFPTTVRNVAVGSVSMFARVGGILSAFAKSFIQLYPLYAYLTFGLCGISAAFLCVLLPETLGRKPPNSFAELVVQSHLRSDEIKITNAVIRVSNEKTPLLAEEGENSVA